MSDFSVLVGEERQPQKVKKVSIFEKVGSYLLQPAFVLTVVCLIVCAFILYISMKSDVIGPALSFLMMSLTVFAAALTHEILSRRQWEEDLTLRYARMIKKIGHLEDQLVMVEDDNKKLKISVVSLIDQLQEKASVRDQRHYQDMLYDLGMNNADQKAVTDTQTDTMTQMMRANSAYRSQTTKPVQQETTATTVLAQGKADIFDDTEPTQQPPVAKKVDYTLQDFDDSETNLSVPTNIKDVVATAVREDRVDIFLQPTVKLPSRKEAFYEVFARLRTDANTFIPANDYLTFAHDSSLMPAIDNLLLLRCVQHMRQEKKNNGSVANAYFINLSMETFTNATFMSDLVDFLSDNEHLAEHLVLEMKQADFNEVESQIWPLMRGLSKIGVRFSLDDVQDFDLNAEKLKQRGIRFIKMDSELLAERVSSSIGERAFREMKKDLEFYDVELIVQKIEEEETLLKLLDVNVDFGQGYLFGYPEHHTKKAA